MEGDLIKTNNWLLPLSWIYGLGVGLRNQLFEMGVLKSRSFDIPVISVGNITVGGSGKTPHVEYLVRLLKDHVKVAVLSRGYKRKSKGFVLADDNTTWADIGDEPYQMHRKYKDIYVAVDKNRCHGIEQLSDDTVAKGTDVVLLDDAYQHRYVKPGINILLVDYHRMITKDKLLPAGRLREPKDGKNRADIVIVTKCPDDMKPMDYRVLTKDLDLYPFQRLFFTAIRYEEMRSMTGNDTLSLEGIDKDTSILLLTGIASPDQMRMDIEKYCSRVHTLSFGDHHQYTAKDIQTIKAEYEKIEGKKIIVTTEKDAVRLADLQDLDDYLRSNIYQLPIKVAFLQDQEETFCDNILSYINKNSKNNILIRNKENKKPQQTDSPKEKDKPLTISFN